MEKRNVVEDKRTPDHEFSRLDDDWDKQAAASFDPALVSEQSESVTREPDEA